MVWVLTPHLPISPSPHLPTPPTPPTLPSLSLLPTPYSLLPTPYPAMLPINHISFLEPSHLGISL
ncbi:MAG: hypothetical protein F6J90_06555 [Moorea sp. SIOASIH]|uniref:hypothetical protein n=1 Tax=Moorena sp. SIOASIH TaxID=2607817 RepID=UPI0013BB75E6|nr:hypothetical protein [Moorena sp. SIOASIH]NEO36002.1 hypothetical protein [Moorena sp. SIOASIH]